MYWKFKGTRVITPTIPFHKIGTNFNFRMQLVTEAGEDWQNCYLSVADSNHVGLIKAKKGSGSQFMTLGELYHETCYIGDLTASTETDIDFRINFPEGSDEGLTNIVVVVGHDDGATTTTTSTTTTSTTTTTTGG